MKRKDFLKKAGQFSIAGMLLPSIFLESCKKDPFFETSDFNGEVLVIGAGVAGLYAGLICQEQGIPFRILEASDEIGGRLGKLEGFADYPLDLGAQWLHGKNSILGDLINRSGTSISLDNSDQVFWFNGELVESIPQDVGAIFEMDDMPNVSFAEHATQQGLGTEYQYIVEALAGDQGADSNLLSAGMNAIEEINWNAGDNDYKFEATFFDLIQREIAVKVGAQVMRNTVVNKIDYSGTKVVVETNNLNYEADKVIVTVPLPVLQDGDIEFVPALTTEKTTAFGAMGMGAGMKVFLKFSNRFYDGNIVGGSVSAAYADESTGKSGNDNVLLAFVMGKQAEDLAALGSDAAIATALIQELDQMYNGEASQSFESVYVKDWAAEPFVRGAYSYSTVETTVESRKVAAAPVAGKLFFAGEAMNTNGHHQTVHGAVETGYRAVREILRGEEK